MYVIRISLANPTQILAHQSWWPWGLTSPASSSQRWGNTERVPTESRHAGTCEVHTGTRHVAQCGLSPELHSVSSVTLDYSIDIFGHYFTGLLGESGFSPGAFTGVQNPSRFGGRQSPDFRQEMPLSGSSPPLG